MKQYLRSRSTFSLRQLFTGDGVLYGRDFVVMAVVFCVVLCDGGCGDSVC